MVYYISFPYVPKINSELFQECSIHTLLFCGGRFRIYILFFQEAHLFADVNSIVEILTEVSARTGENVEDLFSEVGE